MNERICRICTHIEPNHTGKMFECGYVAEFLTSGNVVNFCPCSKFIPMDNLEYLEKKVREKEDQILHL